MENLDLLEKESQGDLQDLEDLHISKGEFDALKNLSQNKHIGIQKPDKGSSTVIVDRDKYLKKMENFLSDQSEFKKTAVNAVNDLDFSTFF